MLSKKPAMRPTILDILNKPFVKAKTVKFISE